MRLNPVLAREIRQRMRGGRVVGVLTLFLILVAGVTAIAYGGSTSTSSIANQMEGEIPFDLEALGGIVLPSDVTRIGQQIFAATTFTMFLLMVFMLPIIASSAISGERERQTLVPLQVTPMRPLQIVAGKFGASLMFVVVLITAALPLLALSYTIGGISVGQIARATIGLLLASFVFSAIGLFSSAVTRRSLTSVLLALILSFGLVLGTFIAASVLAELPIRGDRHPLASRYPLLVSPLAMVADLSASDNPAPAVTSPWDELKTKFTSARADVLLADDAFGRFDEQVGFNEVGVGPAAAPVDAPDGAWNWQLRSILVQGALVAGSLLFAARRIKTPARSER